MNQDRAGARRVLIVEDEHVVAMDMEMQLRAFGYDVTGIADTGSEAIRLAEKTRPDLVLMDVHLQGSMDGFAAADELHKTSDVPVIFISSFTDRESPRNPKLANNRRTLAKPYQPEDLRALVSEVLKQNGLA